MRRGRPRRRARREIVHRPDDDIRRDIAGWIRADQRLAAARLRVEVRSGRAELIGTVPTMFARLTAIADAWRVPGVHDVCHSELTVGPSRDGSLPIDGRLEASLRRLLVTHPDLAGAHIRVTARDGHVVLEGTVREPRAAAIAGELASDHRGVIKVDNLINATAQAGG